MSSGKQSEAINNNKESVKDIKQSQEKKQAVDLQQTVMLERISVQLQHNTKLIEKVEKKLDK